MQITIDFNAVQKLISTINNDFLKVWVTSLMQDIPAKIQESNQRLQDDAELFTNVVLTNLDQVLRTANQLRNAIEKGKIRITANGEKKKIPIDEHDQALLRTLCSKLESVKGIKETLKQKAFIPQSELTELTWQTQALYYEQDVLSQEKTITETLKAIKQSLPATHGSQYSCFISYAWPSQQNQEKEFWLQPFLVRLRKQLRQADIQAILDIKDHKPGGNRYAFVSQAENSDFVLLICTESLLEKHRNNDEIVTTELNHIEAKCKLDDKRSLTRVFPILVSGTRQSSYPEKFHMYAMVHDWRGKSYLSNLNNLLKWILRDQFQDQLLKNHFDLQQAMKKDQVGKMQCDETYRKLVEELKSRAVWQELYQIHIEALKNFQIVIKQKESIKVLNNVSYPWQKLLQKRYVAQSKITLIFNDAPLDIDTIYINLAIVHNEEQKLKEQKLHQFRSELLIGACKDQRISSFEDLYGTKEPVELSRLFEQSKEDKRFPKRLLILGRAGIGKTTLCHYIAYQWANQKLWQEEFQWIFWISLRNLMSRHYREKKEITVAEVIYHECFNSHKEISLLGIEALLNHPETFGNVLLLLDGFDEIAQYHQQDSALGDVIKQLLVHEWTLLTARPYSVHGLDADKTFEMIGFLNQDVVTYIDKFFSSTKQLESKKQPEASTLFNFLKQNPSIWGVAHIPINLELICGVWKKHQAERQADYSTPMTMTALYQEMVYRLSRRYLARRSQNKMDINELKKMSKYQVERNCVVLMEFLERLAFEGFINNKEQLIIKNEIVQRLRKEFETAERNLLTDLLEAGFVKAVGEDESDADKDYYFIHLTFQEYFAARYIANKFKKNNDVTTTAFIHEYYPDPRYEIIFWFAAGLLGEDKQKLEEYFTILLGAKTPAELAKEALKDDKRLQQWLLILRCLEECGVADISRKNLLLDAYYHFANKVLLFDFSHTRNAQNLQNQMKLIITYFRLCPIIRKEAKIDQFLEKASKQKKFFKKPQAILATIYLQANSENLGTFLIKRAANDKLAIEVQAAILTALAEENQWNIEIPTLLKRRFQTIRGLRITILRVVEKLLPHDIHLVDILLQALQDDQDEDLSDIASYCLERILLSNPVIALSDSQLSSLKNQITKEIVAEIDRQLIVLSSSNIRGQLSAIKKVKKLERISSEDQKDLIIQALADNLINPNLTIQAEVIAALKHLKRTMDPRVIQPWLERLSDHSKEIRKNAMNILMKLGQEEAPPVIQAHIKNLDVNDSGIQQTATEALVKSSKIDEQDESTEKPFRRTKPHPIKSLPVATTTFEKPIRETKSIAAVAAPLLKKPLSAKIASEPLPFSTADRNVAPEKLEILLDERKKKFKTIPDLTKNLSNTEIQLEVDAPYINLALIKNLTHSNFEVQETAAKALIKRSEADGIIPALIKNLGNGDARVWQAVVEILIKLDKMDSPEVIFALIKNLSHSVFEVQEAAANELIKLRKTDEMVSALIKNLENYDARVRQAAVEILIKLDKMDSPEVIFALIKNLNHRVFEVQEAAANELIKLSKTSGMVPALIKNLGNSDARVRQAAVEILIKLYKMDSPEVILALMKNLSHSVFKIQEAAAKELIKLSKTDGMVSALIKNLGNSDARVRQAAVEILIKLDKMDSPEVIFALIKNLSHRVFEVQEAAAKELIKLSKTDGMVSALIKNLGNSDARVRQAAVEILIKLDKMDSPEVILALIKNLSHRVFEVQEAAAKELMKLSKTDGRVPALIKNLSNSDARVRQAVAEMLKNLYKANMPKAEQALESKEEAQTYRDTVALLEKKVPTKNSISLKSELATSTSYRRIFLGLNKYKRQSNLEELPGLNKETQTSQQRQEIQSNPEKARIQQDKEGEHCSDTESSSEYTDAASSDEDDILISTP